MPLLSVSVSIYATQIVLRGCSEMSLASFRAGTLFGATPIPVIDNSGGIAPFCDATGQFMPLLCTMNCTLAPEEVANFQSVMTDPHMRLFCHI